MKVLYRIGLICILIMAAGVCFRFVQVLYVPGAFVGREATPLPFRSDDAENVRELNEIADGADEDIQTATKEQTLTCDTVYVIREYDKSTKTEELFPGVLPEQYIGKTREQLTEIVEAYSQAPALKDIEKGFASMEIASFSPQKLVVVKKYFSDMTKEHFYLIVENEYVTVYYSDLQTVYLYTDIYFANLPAPLQQEILDRKYVESEEELYNFLESYTS